MNNQKAIEEKDNKLVLRVHVTPKSSTSVFPAGFDRWRNCIEVKVQAEAQDNKANHEVLEVIAQFCHIPVSQIRIISGLKGRLKVVAISGSELGQIRRRLEDTFYGV
jgi:uncharacterized protein (TIGR00251 family)